MGVSWLTIIDAALPVFFVSVASKGFNGDVSLLFATLAGRFANVALKGLRATVGSNPDRAGGRQCAAVSGDRNGE
jgi:hypothetical protein